MYADLEAMVMVVQRVALLDPIQADTERQVSLCVLCNSEPGVLAADIVHEEGCPWVLARLLRKLPIVGHMAGQHSVPKAQRGLPQTCAECGDTFLVAEPYYVHVRKPNDVWEPLCEKHGQEGVEEGSAVIGHMVEVDTGWIVVPS